MNEFTAITKYIYQDKPEQLWHYTSYDSLHKIVQDDGKLSFRVTEISYLNDHQEFIHGYSIIKNIYDLLRNKHDDDASKIAVLDNIAVFFRFTDELGSNLSVSDNAGVFVLSLTKERDLLSQWRAYTNNCHGVSIGVNSNFKTSHVNNSLLFPVIYDDILKREYAEYIFHEIFEKFSKLSPNEITHNDEILPEFAAKAKVACSLMKDSTFSEESEWRYVIYGENKLNIKLKSSEFYLVPYVDLLIDEGNCDGIIIGPNPYNDLSRKSLTLFTSKVNLGKAIISQSLIPYRG